MSCKYPNLSLRNLGYNPRRQTRYWDMGQLKLDFDFKIEREGYAKTILGELETSLNSHKTVVCFFSKAAQFFVLAKKNCRD